jgi:hypothetical protein
MNVNIPPHPTPTHAIIKKLKQKTAKTPKKQQNTQAPCSAHGN